MLTDSTLHATPPLHRQTEMHQYHIKYHTYEYTVSGHGRVSSPIDRWNANDAARLWAVIMALDKYGLTEDHKYVRIFSISAFT